MSFLPRFRSNRLRRGLGALAVAAAASAAMVGFAAGPASAAGSTIRIAPMSNPFLTVEVQGASNDAGATVDQWSLNFGGNQVWIERPAGTYYQIVNRQSGMCLTTDGVAGDTLYQYYCVNGATTQLWDTNLTAGNTVGYAIKSVASGLYMDVRGGAGWQGADIITWYKTGGTNQYFLATTA